MKILLSLCLLALSPLTTFGQSELKTEERNKIAVLRFYEEVWNKGNVDVAEEVFAPTYLAHDSSAGPSRGTETVEAQKKIALLIRSMFSDYCFTPEFTIAEGDMVVARWTIRGKPKGVLSLISASKVEISGVNIFHFENGKIVEIWNHRDDLGAQKQLGISKISYAVGFIIGLGVCFIIWLGLKLKKRYLSKSSAVIQAQQSEAAVSC